MERVRSVEFCKENGAVDPTTVECCPNVDLMTQKTLLTVSRIRWRGFTWREIPARAGWR